MQTLSSTEEQQLLDGVKQAVDYVDNQEMSPNDALVKVARDKKWSPGFVRAASSAFNNGRQVAQWKANGDVLDKLASFPLADYDSIHETIWGGSEKKAMDRYNGTGLLSPDYSKPPAWLGQEKSAAALLDIPSITVPGPSDEHQAMIDKHASDRRMFKAHSDHKNALRVYEDARTKYASANDLVKLRIMLLENYFKKFAYDRIPFDVVDDAAQTYFGSQGRALMDHVASKFPREKRAADMRRFWDKPINLELAPFSYIKNAIDSAKEIYRTKQAVDRAEAGVKTAKENLRPFCQAPVLNQAQSETPSPSLMGNEKVAFLDMAGAAAVGAGTRSLLNNALDPGKTKAELIEDEWLELEDPEHTNELRAIEAQTNLAQMMSDSRNPISGYSPDEVMKAYNEIAQMAPRTAQQPAALQPLLAKRLAGHIEPFEVKEMADTEKALKDTQQLTPDTNILGGAPNAILG